MLEDTAMHRQTVEEMTDDQLTNEIVNKRERRMRAYRIHEEAVKMEKEAYNQKLLTELKKQCDMLEKDMSTVDRALERCDKRVVKIITIRNELGITIEQQMKEMNNGSETTGHSDTLAGQSGSVGDHDDVRDCGRAESDEAANLPDGATAGSDDQHSDAGDAGRGEHEVNNG